MVLANGFKRYLCLAMIHLCHKTPTLLFCLENFTPRLKLCVKGWKVLPEIIDTSGKEFRWYEKMLLYVVLFDLITCLTGEYHKLSNHVLATEVNAWVWFAVALLFSASDSL